MRLYDQQAGGTISRARQLRREASEPERRLLRTLREACPHLKWRHQVPVGPFYADILCFSERLVIEVDGDTHADAEAYDTRRSRLIEDAGYRVIRLANADVVQNIDGVITQISFSLQEKAGAPKAQKDESDRATGKGAAV